MPTTDPPGPVRDRGSELVDRFGSPLYAFSERRLRENYDRFRSALDEHYPDSRIHFAVKANFNPGILAVLRDAGCGAEAFARCELTAAIRAGFAPDDLLVTGMNRAEADLERALEFGVDRFLVDNAAELTKLESAATVGTVPDVLVRANPAMDVPTDPDIATATRESKFGLDVGSGRAMAVARDAAASDRLRLAGVQLHIGSQITSAEPYAVAARELVAFGGRIRDELGVEIDVVDLGGGFPVAYDEAVPDVDAILGRVAGCVRDACARADLDEPTLLFEPGRRLVGDAGALLATVGVVKETPHATFAVLDAGTNAVSAHWPYPVHALRGGDATETYHVVGPLCYTGDVLAEDVSLPPLERGDVVAIDRVGAYSLGSASHTNAEPKPAVALVRTDGDVELVRERETCADVFARARVPDGL